MTSTRRRWQRRHPDRGSTTVEHALYVSVWLICLTIGVQVMVWGLAQLACHYAANHALQAARVQGGTAAAGQTDATTIVNLLGGDLVDHIQVRVERAADTATVTVSGEAAHVFPFLIIPVHAGAAGPVEALQP